MRFILLLVLFLTSTGSFGCNGGSVGAGSRDLIIPKVPPGVTTARFEHFCMWGPLGSIETVERLLDEAGAQGWEMVTFGEATMCFKRRVGEVTGVAAAPAAAPSSPAKPTHPPSVAPAPTAAPARLPSPPEDG
jgi:hypothetical protein